MRAAWAILARLAFGVGLAWWLGEHDPARDDAARARAGQAEAAQLEDTLRPLYRWRDEHGQLQITDTPPPKGRPYERIAREPDPGIQVDAAR